MPFRLFALVPLSALVLAGCKEQDQEIKTYRVVKPADAKPAAERGGVPTAPTAPDGGGPYRIFGAMFPVDNPNWFFKLTGPADEVAKHEKDIDAFLVSVRFPDGAGKPPAWDVPPAWKVGTPRKSMFPPIATFLVGEKGLEMNVSQVGGGLEMNYTRWVDQVAATADKAKTTREIVGKDGTKGLRVDLTGPKNPSGAMGGPMTAPGK